MQRQRLWVYAVLPPVVLNLGMLLGIGAYFALAATQPSVVAGFNQGQLSFTLSLFICIVEWTFAGLLVGQIGTVGMGRLIARDGPFWRFGGRPALAVFVVLNAIFAAYVVFTIWVNGSWYRIEGLDAAQKFFMLVVLPITAGFCEELIWRGYVFSRLQARGNGLAKAIILSAISFALIHGITLPDKLLTTFAFGVVAAHYYARERNLAPLMLTHIVMDIWSFGLSVI